MPGREPGAAAAAQPRRLHQLDDLFRLHRERLAQRLVALVLQIEIERERVRLANVFGEQRIHVSRRSPEPHADTKTLKHASALLGLGSSWPQALLLLTPIRLSRFRSTT